MPKRFVILHHRLDQGEHWDLMLERGEVLWTWQLLLEPVNAASLPIPARRIADHRKDYLTYEGPVSGDRGTVRRVDSGTYQIESLGPERIELTIGAGRLSGSLTLVRVAEDGWSLECRSSFDVAPPAAAPRAAAPPDVAPRLVGGAE